MYSKFVDYAKERVKTSSKTSAATSSLAG